MSCVTNVLKLSMISKTKVNLMIMIPVWLEFFIPLLIFSIATERALLDLFFDLCGQYFDTKYCSEAVGDFVTSVYNSVTEPYVNATWACQKLALCPYTINYETLDPYVRDVLRDKPETNIPTATNQSTYFVLHMTDIHIDFLYQEVTFYDKRIWQFDREHGQDVEDSNVVELTVDHHQIQKILYKLPDSGVA